jgi:hypothetical protein
MTLSCNEAKPKPNGWQGKSNRTRRRLWSAVANWSSIRQTRHGGFMKRTLMLVAVSCFLLGTVESQAQVVIKAAARPAPLANGIPAGESAAPDGYAPLPAWLGQTSCRNTR